MYESNPAAQGHTVNSFSFLCRYQIFQEAAFLYGQSCQIFPFEQAEFFEINSDG